MQAGKESSLAESQNGTKQIAHKKEMSTNKEVLKEEIENIKGAARRKVKDMRDQMLSLIEKPKCALVLAQSIEPNQVNNEARGSENTEEVRRATVPTTQ